MHMFKVAMHISTSKKVALADSLIASRWCKDSLASNNSHYRVQLALWNYDTVTADTTASSSAPATTNSGAAVAALIQRKRFATLMAYYKECAAVECTADDLYSSAVATANTKLDSYVVLAAKENNSAKRKADAAGITATSASGLPAVQDPKHKLSMKNLIKQSKERMKSSQETAAQKAEKSKPKVKHVGTKMVTGTVI